jgi:hypothetical protein
MMNMASQQRASQLQSERIRQEMEFAQAKEGREVDMQAANIREKDLDIEDKEMLRLYKIGAALLETEDPNAREAGYQNLLGMIDKTSPQLGATMRQVASTFSAPVLEAVMMETEQYFNKKYPNAQATVEYTAKGQKDEQGNLIPEDTPVQVTTGRNSSTSVIRSTPNAASPAPVAAPRTPTGSVPTGKFGATLVTPDSARPLTPYQQDHIRQMQEGLGMTNTPASFSPGASAGQMTPQRAQQVVDAAVKTGMMAQEDFDQMIAMTPEQNKQPFMEMIRANNIKLQPGGMGRQSQFADLRGQPMQSQTAGLRGAPPMEQTLAQDIAVKRKDPNVGAYPGSAQVPIERVRAEAQAGRASPAETAAVETAKIGAQTKAKIAEEERVKTKGRKLFSAALNDMRSDYNTLNKLRAIPSTGRPMLDNMGDYIGASRVGRIVQNAVGSKASVALNNIANSRLTLLNALKEVTNMSAAQLSSNVELMTFLDSLADPTQGYESAMETIRRLENLYGMPAAAQGKRRTPVVASGWGQAKVVGN